MDLDYSLPKRGHRPTRLQAATLETKLIRAVLLILCVTQSTTLWIAYQGWPKLTNIFEQSKSVESRFADISIVLRFLLDQARLGQTQRVKIQEASESELGRDIQIVTVTANTANLRPGPSVEDSPLMTVSRGTRLAVETEQGEWLRVIAPNGERMWIHQDLLTRAG